MTNYGITHVSFVRNVARMRFFSSRTCEFLNREISAKAKTHHSGKFEPRRITC